MRLTLNRLRVISLPIILCNIMPAEVSSQTGINKITDDLDMGLIGYWKLVGDCKDYSGHNNHGINHGVDFAAKAADKAAATFDGAACIEVPDSKSLALSTSEFSISLWAKCNQDIDAVGNILSKYDPAKRRGFNFSIVNNQYRSPANRRNIFFGIDDAQNSPWADCGKCDHVGIWCLCVHKGRLYAGSYTRNNGAYSDMNPQGHVYRYEGQARWTDCGRLGDGSNVLCLASYKGELYGGVSYATGDKGLAGKVYRYDPDNGKWIDCGQVGDSARIECMAVYDGKLYCGVAGATTGSVYYFEGGTRWKACEKKRSGACSLGVCGLNLYASGGSVEQYGGGTSWKDLGRPGGEANYQLWSHASYYGELYVGTFPSGHVYRHKSATEWVDCGRLQTTYQDNGEKEVMALTVYNGKLYGSVWPTGEVYRYDGKTNWTYFGALGKQGHGSKIFWTRASDKHGRGTGSVPWTGDCEGEHPPKAKNYAGAPHLSRTPALALYQGKLFAGTWNWEYDLPGHVYCMEAGKCVTYDHQLDSGWTHLAVVKDSDRIWLYLDGERIASSAQFSAADFNISNSESMKIGFGAQEYFRGAMCHLRIYNRSLNDEEIKVLSVTTKN